MWLDTGRGSRNGDTENKSFVRCVDEDHRVRLETRLRTRDKVKRGPPVQSQHFRVLNSNLFQQSLGKYKGLRKIVFMSTTR